MINILKTTPTAQKSNLKLLWGSFKEKTSQIWVLYKLKWENLSPGWRTSPTGSHLLQRRLLMNDFLQNREKTSITSFSDWLLSLFIILYLIGQEEEEEEDVEEEEEEEEEKEDGFKPKTHNKGVIKKMWHISFYKRISSLFPLMKTPCVLFLYSRTEQRAGRGPASRAQSAGGTAAEQSRGVWTAGGSGRLIYRACSFRASFVTTNRTRLIRRGA